ncbi:MAG: hypothetical protein HY283_00030 [Nitrospirae bacterium]|nr:hypothetical protein [Nitrospirota bacterium]
MSPFYPWSDRIFGVTAGFVLAGLLGLSPPAQALDFKVYPYNTPNEDEVELAYWWTDFVQSDKRYNYFGKVLDKQGLQQQSLEIEYGMTDRWTIAGYADFEKPKDGDFKYVQARAVMSRYRFFEQGERFLDGAVEIEYYLPYKKYSNGEKVETRVIIEKDIRQISIMLNPIFEKDVSGSEVEAGMEFEYAAGLYFRATPLLTPGLEFYGVMGELSNMKPKDQQEHYIFPRLGLKLGHRAKFDLGYGFGLTQASDDRVIKAILELEFP